MDRIYGILNWAFGLFFLLMGFGRAANLHWVSAGLFAAAGCLLLPPVRTYATMTTGRTLPWPVRVLGVAALLLLIGFLGRER